MTRSTLNKKKISLQLSKYTKWQTPRIAVDMVCQRQGTTLASWPTLVKKGVALWNEVCLKKNILCYLSTCTSLQAFHLHCSRRNPYEVLIRIPLVSSLRIEIRPENSSESTPVTEYLVSSPNAGYAQATSMRLPTFPILHHSKWVDQTIFVCEEKCSLQNPCYHQGAVLRCVQLAVHLTATSWRYRVVQYFRELRTFPHLTASYRRNLD